MPGVTHEVIVAFALTLFAGLATGVGSVIAFFARRTDYRFLGIAMGFSAGVMLYVSFTEILSKAEAATSSAYGTTAGGWITLLSFFGGIAFIGIIDALVPKTRNPHEPRTRADLSRLKQGTTTNQTPVSDTRPQLMRTGRFTALAIGIHNFPEGMVTFLTALDDVSLGIALAVAVALHNIPEGISVSVPIYYATGSRHRAVIYSALSGFAEPIGAAIGYVVLRAFFTDEVTGLLFGAVAGIMIYISLDELLPAAHEYGGEHAALFGIIAGMAVMAVSLVLLR
jgi:ZIP family zinc transporter